MIQNLAKIGPDGCDDALERALVEALLSQKKKIACAESCTGGGIGARLTAVPGASDVFDGGVISYANEVKERLLGVSPKTLSAYGAVSAPCAKEMAQGVLSLMKADLAVAVTGIAGPGGGTPEKPVGTVFIAVAVKGKEPMAHEFHFSGDRQQVRHQTASNAFTLALEAL